MASRRTFLQQSAGGAVALTAASVSVLAAQQDRIPIAVVGCGNMGTNHLRSLATRKDVDIRYVCDVDKTRLASAAKLVEASGNAPQTVTDLRRILDDKDVKAVWHATPDHWHSPGGILTADAGKHAYVEKPCSHNVREGRLLVEAGVRNKVVIQIGTQARSAETVQAAMKRLHDGAIGEVLVAKAWNSQLRRNLGKVKPSAPPAELDYAMWQGPAPEAPYLANRIPGTWRFFFDYGVGDIGNDGVHNIDIACWGLQLDRLPTRVAAMGGKYFFDDDQQWPDTQYIACELAPKDAKGRTRQLIFEQRIWSPYVQEEYENGNAFYGTKGMLIIGHTIGWKLYGPKNVLIDEQKSRVSLPAHHSNFVQAIRGGGKPNAPALGGHVAAGVCHLANIATRLGRTLTIDPATETIVGDEQAQAMTKRAYRDGHWAVPKGL
jgi:predicted dehydrogenase